MPFMHPALHVQDLKHALPAPAVRLSTKVQAGRLGWSLLTEAEDRIVFRTPISWRSWGEVVTVDLRASRLTVESRCRCGTQVVDWGQNRRNCAALAAGLAASPAGGTRIV